MCLYTESSVEGASYRCATLPARSVSRWYGKFLPALLFRKVDKTGFDILHFHGDDYLCRGSLRRVRTFYGSALNEALHAGSMGRRCYQALFYLLEWVSCLKKGELAAISETTCRSLPLVKEHIPCCVPLDRYCPSGRKTAYPSIMFLGDFNSRKRGGLLLDIFSAEILPKFSDCLLSVVGPVPCSGKGIRYLGRCSEDELIAAYRESWILCMPSSYEGFGVPVVEAMACGTAVIATRNPGSEQLIRNEVDGLLCSPDQLATTLLRLLGDQQMRDALTKEGFATSKSYDSREVAYRYLKLYGVF